MRHAQCITILILEELANFPFALTCVPTRVQLRYVRPGSWVGFGEAIVGESRWNWSIVPNSRGETVYREVVVTPTTRPYMADALPAAAVALPVDVAVTLGYHIADGLVSLTCLPVTLPQQQAVQIIPPPPSEYPETLRVR